jgi:hypothetical protein
MLDPQIPDPGVPETGAIKQALESLVIEVGDLNLTVRHNSVLADAPVLGAAMFNQSAASGADTWRATQETETSLDRKARWRA